MRSHINVGAGVDYSIRTLAEMLAKITGFRGKLTFDASRPDGAPKKLLDVSRLAALGWRSSMTLEDGLRDTYAWFLQNVERIRT
jgi:GDP-L-fucose synthase